MSRSDRQHMLNSLKFSDWPTELDPLIGIGQSIVHAAFHAPDHLLDADSGAEGHQAVTVEIIWRRTNVTRVQLHAVEMHFNAWFIGHVAACLARPRVLRARPTEKSLAVRVAREHQHRRSLRAPWYVVRGAMQHEAVRIFGDYQAILGIDRCQRHRPRQRIAAGIAPQAIGHHCFGQRKRHRIKGCA